MRTHSDYKMVVAFTFDDATKDHAEYAARILEVYGYRGIFNIVTDVIGRDEMFLTRDDVRDLLLQGHEIAAQGMENHSGLNPDSLLKKWNRGDRASVLHQIVGSRIASLMRYSGLNLEACESKDNSTISYVDCSQRDGTLLRVEIEQSLDYLKHIAK